MKHIILVAWLVGLFAAHACWAQHAAPHIEPRFAVGVVMSEHLARSEVGVVVRAMLHDATLVPDDGSVRFTTTTFGDDGTGCADLASAMECAASTLKLSAPDAYRHVLVIVDELPLAGRVQRLAGPRVPTADGGDHVPDGWAVLSSVLPPPHVLRGGGLRR